MQPCILSPSWLCQHSDYHGNPSLDLNIAYDYIVWCSRILSKSHRVGGALLLFQTYCCSRFIVVPDLLLFQTYCCSRLIVVPDLLLFQTYCCSRLIVVCSRFIVVPDLLLLQTYCYFIFIAVPDLQLLQFYLCLIS